MSAFEYSFHLFYKMYEANEYLKNREHIFTTFATNSPFYVKFIPNELKQREF